MRSRTLVPILVACVLTFGWLNQGFSKARKEEIVAADAADEAVHGRSRLHWARNALLDLYEQANDQEIYFAVANAMRGLPYDRERLAFRGHGEGTPASFTRGPPVDGHWHVPYAEVPSEYPAAMIPFMLLPRFVSGSDFGTYARIISALMGALLLAAAAVAIRAQPARDDRERWWAMVALLGAQGSLAIQRLDAVVALLLAWTLWAAVHRRPATTGVGLGLSAATKIIPALLTPLVVVADRAAWRLPGARRRGAVAFTLAAVLGLLPMFVIPGALKEVLSYHVLRPLQVESSYGVLLSVWELATGTSNPATLTYGSYNLDGAAASFLAHVSTPLSFVCLAAVTVWFARAPEPTDDVARRDRIALALLAGLATLWLSSKVFSPQYLTWGMPLVLAVSGKRGVRLTWLLVAIMIVTQIYLRGYYGQVVLQTPLGVGTLVVRLALLVVFAMRVFAREGAEGAAVAERAAV